MHEMNMVSSLHRIAVHIWAVRGLLSWGTSGSSDLQRSIDSVAPSPSGTCSSGVEIGCCWRLIRLLIRSVIACLQVWGVPERAAPELHAG